MKELNKKFHVPSSRKPPPLPLATAIICEKMEEDIARRNGPNEVAKAIAAEGEYVIPRCIVLGYCGLEIVTHIAFQGHGSRGHDGQ